jgi:hypothetical protein
MGDGEGLIVVGLANADVEKAKRGIRQGAMTS